MASMDDFRRKMAAERLPEVAIETFCHYYQQLTEGESGLIAEHDIRPLGEHDIASYSTLQAHAPRGIRELPHCAVLKLNGGLGTSMGLQKAKSLIRAKNGLTFLDCALLQVRALHDRYGTHVPFILMNSFSTDRDSLDAISHYTELERDAALRFLQHKFPRILRDGLTPVSWPAAPALEWNPPGHGDLYPALISSGMLAQLRARHIRYLFVSNSDNLGADLDPVLLGAFAESGAAFFMEVATRTPMDRKGGHLARHVNGRLVLRESAQCPEADTEAFRDVARHHYFNTNNLWLDLEQIASAIDRHGGILPLPLIVNPKTLDPRDPSSPPIYQLETAMGAAISVFDNSMAVLVPRTRFCPVKTCNDLLNLRSDRMQLTPDYRIIPQPGTTTHISIDLDKRFFGRIDDFETRFSRGAPSLVACDSFTVVGDVGFGPDVSARGNVRIENRGSSAVTIGQGRELDDCTVTYDN